MKIAVLLSSYNGEKYISEQIKSVFEQKDVEVTLFIRDDGSTDNTRTILKKFENHEKCRIFYERNVGVVKSFFSLLVKAEGYDYYSFCDQDDVWESDKLKIAIETLKKCTGNYKMYYSKTLPVDCNLIPLRQRNENPDEEHDFNLRELMLRNNAIGCTMVINDKLRNKLISCLPENVIMHDHWIYIVTRALGGDVAYDRIPHVKYRQHDSNVVGHKMNIKAKLRFSSFFKNKRIRSKIASELLEKYGESMTSENKAIIQCCAEYRHSFKKKIILISSEARYTKNRRDKIIFIVEALTGVY